MRNQRARGLGAQKIKELETFVGRIPYQTKNKEP